MLALLAMSSSLRLKPRALPSSSSTPRCVASAMAEKRKSTGAVLITSATLALAPMVA